MALNVSIELYQHFYGGEPIDIKACSNEIKSFSNEIAIKANSIQAAYINNPSDQKNWCLYALKDKNYLGISFAGLLPNYQRPTPITQTIIFNKTDFLNHNGLISKIIDMSNINEISGAKISICADINDSLNISFTAQTLESIIEKLRQLLNGICISFSFNEIDYIDFFYILLPDSFKEKITISCNLKGIDSEIFIYDSGLMPVNKKHGIIYNYETSTDEYVNYVKGLLSGEKNIHRQFLIKKINDFNNKMVKKSINIGVKNTIFKNEKTEYRNITPKNTINSDKKEVTHSGYKKFYIFLFLFLLILIPLNFIIKSEVNNEIQLEQKETQNEKNVNNLSHSKQLIDLIFLDDLLINSQKTQNSEHRFNTAETVIKALKNECYLIIQEQENLKFEKENKIFKNELLIYSGFNVKPVINLKFQDFFGKFNNYIDLKETEENFIINKDSGETKILSMFDSNSFQQKLARRIIIEQYFSNFFDEHKFTKLINLYYNIKIMSGKYESEYLRILYDKLLNERIIEDNQICYDKDFIKILPNMINELFKDDTGEVRTQINELDFYNKTYELNALKTYYDLIERNWDANTLSLKEFLRNKVSKNNGE